MHAPPDPGPSRHVGLSNDVVSGPAGSLARVWTARCDSPADFSSIASVNPGIGFVRVGGATAVHLRGPQTKATTLSCPRDAEYFGADFRLGAYLPMFPPARLANLQDAVLPTLPDGRILLDGRAWQMPAPQNIDVFIDRLKRAGLLVFDALLLEFALGAGLFLAAFPLPLGLHAPGLLLQQARALRGDRRPGRAAPRHPDQPAVMRRPRRNTVRGSLAHPRPHSRATPSPANRTVPRSDNQANAPLVPQQPPRILACSLTSTADSRHLQGDRHRSVSRAGIAGINSASQDCGQEPGASPVSDLGSG